MNSPEKIVENDAGAARRFNFNTVSGILFAVLSVVLFLIIPDQIEKPLFVFEESENDLKPSLFPQLVAAGFGALGVWLFFKSFSVREENELKNLNRQAIANVLVTLLVMALYTPLLMQVGFVVASAIVIATLSTFFGNKSYGLTALVSIAVPISIFYVFTKLLATYLPPFPIDTLLTRFSIL